MRWSPAAWASPNGSNQVWRLYHTSSLPRILYVPSNMIKIASFSYPSTLSINSMWPSNTLVQLMACFLMAPSHYLNQCWLSIIMVLRHSNKGNCTGNAHESNHNTFENHTFKLKPHTTGDNEFSKWNLQVPTLQISCSERGITAPTMPPPPPPPPIWEWTSNYLGMLGLKFKPCW